MKKLSKWEDVSQLGEARDSVVRSITSQVARRLADQLDRVIFMALCTHFGGPYFAWDNLRGRCECVKQAGQPDRYLVDGVLVLEISEDEPQRYSEPIAIYNAPHQIRAGFCYRIVTRPE